MAQSTWWNITHGMHAALHKGYIRKSQRQRARREVADVMRRADEFCWEMQVLLGKGDYEIGEYRHFRLREKSKERDISVLPFRDRCVQNDVKNAIEPLLMRQMTDQMMGGLPERGVLSNTKRYSVVSQMKRLLNDTTLTHYIQGDIRKFYDNVDNVVAMHLVERQVKDKRTLAIIRQHLFKQKRLAIGDPFSHLIANIVMSVIVRGLKSKFPGIIMVNFADDIFIPGHSAEELKPIRKEMRRIAKTVRLHYKRIYIRPIDTCSNEGIVFCGYKYYRGVTRLTQQTKKRYVKARHKKRSMGSYQGIIQVADTKHLQIRVERQDNKRMSSEKKIHRPFAGRPMNIETLTGIKHTVVDFQKKPSTQKDCDMYYHVQAIADALGLIVYSTGSEKICKYLDTKSRQDIPLRDLKIAHDWSGFYYEGTVYTDAEEEAMIREQYHIH